MIDAAILSTNIVQPKARLRFWQDVVCDTFVELDCHAVRTHPFFGSLTNRSLLNIQFSDVRAAPQKVMRTRAKIARSTHD
jgi:hypothetical protein